MPKKTRIKPIESRLRPPAMVSRSSSLNLLSCLDWYDVLRINGDGPYTLTPTLGAYIPLDPRVVAGLAYLQLTTDADETGREVAVSTRAID